MSGFPQHIIHDSDYNDAEHAQLGLKRFAQIIDGRAHWIFRAEFAPPYAPPADVLVEVTDRPEVKEGWLYDAKTGQFTDPASLITDEQRLKEIRTERNILIAETDWIMLRHRDEVELGGERTLTDQQAAALALYRGALRDMPNTCDPRSPVWPVKPDFLP